jgi:hypothetical protein
MSIQRIITAITGSVCLLMAHASLAAQVDILGPSGSVAFGSRVAVLPNGNMVITDPRDPSGGAAYLYSANRTLISKVIGVNPRADSFSAFDTIKIVVLTNGNYLLVNRHWDNGSVTDVGMVAWGSETSGISGAISSANALIGSTSGDEVGQDGVTVLTNGNYVVGTHNWSNGAITAVGAATWGNGSTGIAGHVSSANSLIGTTANDYVGYVGHVFALTNGNYVVSTPSWSSPTVAVAGATTWGNGSTGVKGPVSAANSLIGSTPYDCVLDGNVPVTPLANGNYVVATPYWDNGTQADAGAATWGNGATGTTGVISPAISLVGNKAGNYVGFPRVVALSNGNYVVSSAVWAGATGINRGAATWGNGNTGTIGVVSAANSLIGSQDYQYLGGDPEYIITGVYALANGNYVVNTPRWSDGVTANLGAVTWGNGTTGLVGVASASNSLIGAQAEDRVGLAGVNGVAVLSNGNYVVSTSKWHNAAGVSVGAATWANGSTGLIGVVTPANSLIGSGYDGIQVTPLANGNYVVSIAGAVTWGNGSSGRVGTISPDNSLVGAGAAFALSDGNYVVCSSSWNNGVPGAGAITWSDGVSGAVGEVSASNSLIGTTASDGLCSGGLDTAGLTALPDGRYVAYSPGWDNGGIIDAEAMTLGVGSLTGSIGPETSVLGTVAYGGDSNGGVAGHDGMFFGYDAARQRLAVGRPASNRVTLLTIPAVTGPALSIGDVAISEGDSGAKVMTFTVNLSQASSSNVGFSIGTANGTATAGSDYVALPLTTGSIPAGQTSQSFAVTINGDTTVEPNETFTVNLSNASGATIADAQAVGTISNDDVATLSIADVSMAEGNSGTKVMTFTVQLSAPSSTAVTYNIATANGTATNGSDYIFSSLSGQTIPAGQTSKTFSVTINGDTTVEPNETFFVNVSNVVGATVADGQAIGTISNDDTTNLSIADVSITEGNSGSKLATFTVSLSAPSSTAITYNIATADASAKAGTDYTANSLSGQSIPAGQTSKTFTVAILGDTTVEWNKSFVVNVTSVVGATVTDGVANGIILNDDGPTLSIGDISTAEGNAGTTLATFTVRLSQAAAVPVTYNIATANGGATAGSGDYVAKNLVGETIPAGQTSRTFTVTINGDTTLEQNEAYYVNLSGSTGASILDSQAVGYIVNDDGPTLSINDAAVTEGNSGTTLMTFTVTLSQAAATAVTYNLATSNVTATAGSDYVAVPSTPQSIPAGQLSKTFSVTINGDTTVEPNETFLVNMTNTVGASKFDGAGIGTITNDDGAALRIASVTTGGLYDDIDDGNGALVLSMNDYALLLQDTAQRICQRAPTATIVAVDDVENRSVLGDLADATNLTCNTQPHYAAVMAPGDSRGFLIAVPPPNTRGLQVLGPPETFADADSTALSVLGVGQSQPVTVLLASAAAGTPPVRRAQAQALAQRVQQRFAQDANANVIVLGANAVNGLVDLTVRAQPPANRRGIALPNDRILVSPGLLRQFRAHAEFMPLPPTDEPAQYLQLQQ